MPSSSHGHGATSCRARAGGSALATALPLTALPRTAFSVAALTFAMACAPAARPRRIARDPVLRAEPVFLYPAVGNARAFVLFFGNDVGFWEAHQHLAESLSARGYDVAGLDVVRVLDRLPPDRTARERAFAAYVQVLVPRLRREMADTALPLVLAGHSFGADLALWLAASGPPPGTIGVLAISPTSRTHFYVTALDRANLAEPHDAASFAIADDITAAPKGLGIALLRGESDRRRDEDSALRAAGGERLDYTVIPLAGHSLRSLVIAGPVIGRALDRLVAAHGRRGALSHGRHLDSFPA